MSPNALRPLFYMLVLLEVEHRWIWLCECIELEIFDLPLPAICYAFLQLATAVDPARLHEDGFDIILKATVAIRIPNRVGGHFKRVTKSRRWNLGFFRRRIRARKWIVWCYATSLVIPDSNHLYRYVWKCAGEVCYAKRHVLTEKLVVHFLLISTRCLPGLFYQV